jgi:hypothetical protein
LLPRYGYSRATGWMLNTTGTISRSRHSVVQSAGDSCKRRVVTPAPRNLHKC